jgi:hypothetical protein
MEDVYNGELNPDIVGWRLDFAGLSHGHHDENCATDGLIGTMTGNSRCVAVP